MQGSRLKRWLHVAAGLACAVGSVACAVTAWHQPDSPKRFMADEEVKDLGALKQQGEGDAHFRLLNPMKIPVEIVRVSTNCTCTRAEAAASSLGPGEATDLTAHLRVGNLRGRVVARLDVLYRAGGSPTLERLPLAITATVEPHYTVTPEEAVMSCGGDSDPGSRQEARVTIRANGPPTLRVLEVYSTHPAVRVEQVCPDLTAGGATIRLALDRARCVAPSFRATIVVHTDSKMEPTYRVPVRVMSE